MSGKRLAGKLRNREYREAWVEAHIDNSIAFQIASLRKARGGDQKTLEEKAGIGQTAISRLEDPDYGRQSLTTLKKIAAVFDVALEVRFIPFSELAESVNELSPAFYLPASFPEDLRAHDSNQAAAGAACAVRKTASRGPAKASRPKRPGRGQALEMAIRPGPGPKP